MDLKRRDILIGLSGLAFWGFSRCSQEKSTDNAQQERVERLTIMELRPHHILDIISEHGKDTKYQPHPYGHSLHIVTPKLLSNLDIKIKLVVEADAICEGCKYLQVDGKCKDVLAQLTPSPSKQAYNDVLDSRLLDHFGIEINSVMTFHKYLEIVNDNVPGIEKICTHPKENEQERLHGLVQGLIKLGIREA